MITILNINNKIYNILQAGGFDLGFLSTARTASSNTCCKLSFFFAEHSTKLCACISLRSRRPSLVVTNFSEFGMRKSSLVPTSTTGTFCPKCRISGHHLLLMLSNEVRLLIE